MDSKTKQEMAFEERMSKRKTKVNEEEKRRVEQLQSDYLKRTGRAEMKP